MTSPTRSRLYTTLFACFWSLITLSFLAFAIYGACNQYCTLSFAATHGIIDDISQTTSHSSGTHGGSTYGVHAQYEYVANGIRYHSDRVRFASSSSSDNWASTFVQNHRAGSIVPVFYNPANPAESVLIRGVEGADLFLFMFLTPFVMCMMFLWLTAFRTFFPANISRSLVVSEHGPITRIRPPLRNAPIAGAITLTLGTFSATFIIAFLGGGFHPTLRVASLTIEILLALTILATVISFFRILLGARDITLDETQHLLLAPRNRRIPYSAVSGVHVAFANNNVEPRRSNNDYAFFQVIIRYMQDKMPKELCIKSASSNRPAAERLATYLALRLHAPALGPDNTPLLSADTTT